MGSVIDYIECPNCKSEAYSDFYYKTGEEYINCSYCGYYFSAEIINRDKKLSELTDEDWKITELKNPYGSFRMKSVGSVGRLVGTIDTEEAYKELINSAGGDETIESLEISRLVNGKIIVDKII